MNSRVHPGVEKPSMLRTRVGCCSSVTSGRCVSDQTLSMVRICSRHRFNADEPRGNLSDFCGNAAVASVVYLVRHRPYSPQSRSLIAYKLGS